MVDKALLDREMWSLSKDEAEAVRKRVDTLTTATLKKRKQQRADVRKVFAGQTQVCCVSLYNTMMAMNSDGQKKCNNLWLVWIWLSYSTVWLSLTFLAISVYCRENVTLLWHLGCI